MNKPWERKAARFLSRFITPEQARELDRANRAFATALFSVQLLVLLVILAILAAAAAH